MPAQEKKQDYFVFQVKGMTVTYNEENGLHVVSANRVHVSGDIILPESNDNYVPAKERHLGDKMEDGSYYMGVSKDTGTDFFLFIESAGQNKTADVVAFNHGTKLLKKKHKNNELFHGHKYSAFQLESDIIASHKHYMADGGIRRLTIKEWGQVEGVFEKEPELRAMALEVCAKEHRVQSASPSDFEGAWFQSLRSGDQLDSYRSSDVSVLVGRSEPRP